MTRLQTKGKPENGTNRLITRAERDRLCKHTPYVTNRCFIGCDLMGHVIILSKHKNPLPIDDTIKIRLVGSLERFWSAK